MPAMNGSRMELNTIRKPTNTAKAISQKKICRRSATGVDMRCHDHLA